MTRIEITSCVFGFPNPQAPPASKRIALESVTWAVSCYTTDTYGRSGMKIFVTGSTGFVGSHLVEWLTQQGHEVWGLFRDEAKRTTFAPSCHGVKGTLRSSDHEANAWIDQLPPDLDAVAHVAGLTMAYFDHQFDAVNQIGTRYLVRDLKQRYPDQLRMLLVSSLAAAGPSTTGRVEEEPLQPVSAYGKSKMLAEQALHEEAPASWERIIVRPPIVIGPRDPGMLDLFKMVRGRLMFVPGFLKRNKPFSFVGVGDLARMIGLCLERSHPEPTCYFSAYPQPVPFETIVQSIQELLGIRAISIHMPIWPLRGVARLGRFLSRLGMGKAIPLTPDKVREARQGGWVCSSQRSVEQLGMTYQQNLDDALKDAYVDYQNRGWI